MIDPVTLGERYADPHSGFTGVADARCEYLYTTPQVRLVAETGKSEALRKEWFEEAQVVPTEDSRVGFGS